MRVLLLTVALAGIVAFLIWGGQQLTEPHLRRREHERAAELGVRLHAAIREGDQHRVVFLLEQKWETFPWGEMGLFLAALRGDTDIVRALLDRGVQMDWRGGDGATPLHYAALRGHAKVVNLLLDRGADVNARLPGGGTALMQAARYGHPDVVRVLLRRGADSRISNKLDETALRLAQRGRTDGRREAAKILTRTSRPPR